MNYQQAYQYLESLSNIPREEYMDANKTKASFLDRVHGLLDILGNPEKKIPHYIHITGTSGKGSVSLMLHELLKEAGYAVGTTISPHPTYITERWRTHQGIMTKQEFAKVITACAEALEIYVQTNKKDIPSFFDMTAVIALYYFAQKKVEWAIIEVGCGGRYDATNSIPYKDIAVITNVGLDHTQLLGDTKEKIAYEKAGIITGPCHVYTTEKESHIRTIFEKQCIKKKASLTYIKNTTTHHTMTNKGMTFTYKNKSYTVKNYGKHQAYNAALVISIGEHLGIKSTTIKKALGHTQLPIRLEYVSQKPCIILDSAHNEDKMQTTVQTIKQYQPIKGNIHLIVGFSENKNSEAMVAALASLSPTTVICTRNTIDPFRKVSHPHDIATLFQKYTPQATIHTYLDPKNALAAAAHIQQKTDTLLITGSVFLAGELRPYLTNT